MKINFGGIFELQRPAFCKRPLVFCVAISPEWCVDGEMFKSSYLAQLKIVPCMKILFGGKGNSLKFKGPGLFCPFFKKGLGI